MHTKTKANTEPPLKWEVQQLCLTHTCLASFNGTSANSADPDQTPQNTVSDQALRMFNKKFNKNEKRSSIRQKWVNETNATWSGFQLCRSFVLKGLRRC